jgi:hypothetical protein
MVVLAGALPRSAAGWPVRRTVIEFNCRLQAISSREEAPRILSSHDVMTPFDPNTYGPVFAPLLATERRRPLDAGAPDRGTCDLLRQLSADTAFRHAHIADHEAAKCCLSAVWLLHDFLDESHTICQEIDTASGSFWHGIMHRREGDFSNAKYWFRRVGRHGAFEAIGQRAAELAAVRGDERSIKKLITTGAWDPFAFVDLCEAAIRGHGTSLELCLDIQQAEWEILFDCCYRQVIA